MGRTASSSKRKSSKKKKTSKVSSEGRRSKRSKRNNKSKKLLRREDSLSFSDDDSTSSMSVLSSSSEDDYTSRRARSRKQTNVKSSKKRAPRRSPSKERSKDAMRVKKNRGAKRKHRDSETTKKRKYKKSRRDTSVSCSSCSTSSSGESEFERRRGRSREKGDSGKPRSGNKKRKNRSLSCSSLSRFSDASGDESEEKVAVEVNSRRLRSVIMVAKRAEERDENEDKKDDVHTDEIVYEHDDYPSRSNDSNDGANKRELHQSCVESNERIRVENVLGQEDSDSKLTTNEFMISTTNPMKENESGVSATVDGSSGGQDLESILRQKALENLKRFRGGSQTIEKPRANEFVQSKSPKQDDSVSVDVAKFAYPKLSRDSSISTWTEGKTLDGKESNPTRGEGMILDGKESLSTRGGERKIPAGGNRGIEPGSSQSESSLSKSRQESLGGGSTLKPEPVSLTSPNASSVVNKNSSVNKGAGETSQTGGEISGISRGSREVNDGRGSTGTEPVSRVEPSSEEQHGSREGQDQVKDSSQFQQKTMSVMRGGEMVQVSYKVYIPKKAPALARRQLQR